MWWIIGGNMMVESDKPVLNLMERLHKLRCRCGKETIFDIGFVQSVEHPIRAKLRCPKCGAILAEYKEE